MMRVLGKGCAGKVLLVRHRASSALYALKAITKRHVLAHQELQHTLTEQAVLKRMAHEATDPFVVKLWWSFHDKENLFLVMDFHPGGDLATQLARWGRLGRDRARFYAAEIVEGVDGLHAAGVIYRDLKPENILIGADGHIVLTDFGLSKEFPRRVGVPPTPKGGEGGAGGADAFYSSAPAAPGTPSPAPALPHWMGGPVAAGVAGDWTAGAGASGAGSKDATSTFCGTAEYLAPEVIQGLPYSYEVDWWSFGTMLYEMLTGITPFWANNHSDMYVRVLQDELQFPDDKAMDQDTKSLIRGLLQRNPALRMSEPRIKRHPYFSMIDWSHVYNKRYIPPYIPPIDPSNASDTQNFDEAFLDMDPTIDNDEPDPDQDSTPTPATDSAQTDSERADESDRSPGPGPGTARGSAEEEGDAFDGYSFKGRHSVILDGGEEEEEEEGEEDDEGYEGHVEDEDGEGEVEVEVEEGTEVVVVDGAPTVVLEAGTPVVEVAPETVVEVAPVPPAKDVVVAEAAPAPVLEQPSQEQHVGPGEQVAPVPVSPVTAPIPATAPAPPPPPPPPPADAKPPAPPPKTALKPPAEPQARDPQPRPSKAVTIATPRPQPRRREKSGVAALDRYLAHVPAEPEEDLDTVTERDDDDWDFVETPGGEDRNGAKGTSLFARGVVDRYRLAVFRKASGGQPRSFSGLSVDSDIGGSGSGDAAAVGSAAAAAAAAAAGVTASPSPSEKRRGRTTGLSLGKSTRQFLRARSPPSTFSAGTRSVSRTTVASAQHPGTVSSASSGLLTPSPSVPTSASTPAGRSLKSKDSTTSMGSPSGSSDGDRRSLSQSAADLTVVGAGAGVVGTGSSPASGVGEGVKRAGEEGAQKVKKMKRYKEGAEKVLSLFGSPRQERTQPSSSQSQAQS
ncbi:kinase-like protein [Ramaria rubella]|nr:kinase-like protein [Ramaria rubella]